ncbi:PepSY domain-containing protein [Ferrimonas balearica]|uniref:PepSY domain-containing protein n=1 Tax=Ferrimonas balearica TaxID=44012 RepID=UPI001C997054|nr:hypothetical protein [Ferrimonas balearica]MBY5993369.1 hypothetical protein [Ferrimonas balearica]
MKHLIWLPLFLLAFPGWAASELYLQLEKNPSPAPLTILKQVERDYGHQGQVIEFELELEAGAITYEVSLAAPERGQTLELKLDRTGGLLEKEWESDELDDESERVALRALRNRPGRFADLVALAIAGQEGFLLEAQLDHNIGISYLEVELLTPQGKRKLALDLDTGERLPILQWD